LAETCVTLRLLSVPLHQQDEPVLLFILSCVIVTVLTGLLLASAVSFNMGPATDCATGLQQQPHHACSIHRWQAGGTQSKQQRNINTPDATYTMLSNCAEHLQLIEKLEKQLFAKSDGWRGRLQDRAACSRVEHTVLHLNIPSSGRQHCAACYSSSNMTTCGVMVGTEGGVAAVFIHKHSYSSAIP
jgi:hypothetical protein